MIGLIYQSPSDIGGVAPSLPPALYPVGDRLAVEGVVNELAPIVEDVVLLADDPEIQAVATGANESITVAESADSISDRLPVESDQVIAASASTHAGRSDLRSLAKRTDTVLRPDGRSQGHPPHEVYTVSSLRDDTRSIGDGIETVSELVADIAARTDGSELTADRLYDVARPWDLLAATEHVLDGLDRSLAGDVHPLADCRGPVVVEPGARVGAGVVVEGPAFIARGATVGPNAYIRGATYLGDGAHVGNGVEIKNSILFPNARVPHLSYVGDSVVGPNANLGAGTIVANLRHDGEPVEAAYDGERASTGRRKFGAVVGADARVGIGTCVNAGVRLSAGSMTSPGETVLRDVDGDDDRDAAPDDSEGADKHASTDTPK
jgi:acetyltransferase-like isoleucine patch superfamily enzyme